MVRVAVIYLLFILIALSMSSRRNFILHPDASGVPESSVWTPGFNPVTFLAP
jgi:hypothetical protein